ncbi:MAG: DNRLRE domain-containing protein [Pirellulales bacterium]
MQHLSTAHPAPRFSASRRRPVARLLPGVAVLAALLPAFASGQSVVLSGSTVGSTPARLGYNLGDFNNDNTASWWRYTGANAGRMFTSPSTLTPSSVIKSTTNAALNASTQSQFLAQRDALRAGGTSSTYINWSSIESTYNSNVAYSSNEINARFADATIGDAGGTTLVVMQRTPAAYPWPATASDNTSTDWQNRWLGWQQWYAQAFTRARYENVTRYQLFNEPDLYTTGTLTQAQWIEMIKYGADAVSCAVADVNRLFGKNLTPAISGPVTNGPALTVTGSDWGDTLLANRNMPMLSGTAVPGYQLFQFFDYHNYGSSPTTFGTKLAGAITDIGTITGGQTADYPVTLSEFNTRTGANYNPNDPVLNPNGYTPDSLAMSSRLGQIVANLANNKPEELYLFKFSNSGNAYNGVHWQSNLGNVGGASKSAMVYNLFTEGFTGNDLLAAPVISGTEVTLAASRSPASGTRYLLAANANLTGGKSLSIDLSSWNIPAGTVVTVEQVSDLHQGDVSQTITVGSNRTISVSQDPGGVVLVRVPSAIETRTAIAASQDAFVNQASGTTSFNGTELRVRNSGTATSGRDVAYLKFPLAGLDPNTLTSALLGIYARDPGATSGTTAGIITHVYGLTDNAWSAGSITWNNAPNLGDPAATISTIDDNYVGSLGVSAEIVGQFAATGTEQLLSIDVTRWVTERMAAGASNLTFMIARQIRYDGDVDASQSLSIRSSEYAGGAFAPTLTVAAVPEPTVSGLVTLAPLIAVVLAGAASIRRDRT